MSRTVAVLGANGVYARHLIPRLTESCRRRKSPAMSHLHVEIEIGNGVDQR